MKRKETISTSEFLQENNSQACWDQDFLFLAKSWSERRSKDPSTKVGAVITTPDNRLVSLGYNGFPRRVKDLPERYNKRQLKYAMVCHAERNAIVFAKQDLEGCTIYTYPFMSCSVCAGLVINSGIRRCVAPPLPEHLKKRWGKNIKVSLDMFKEAGIQIDIIEFKEKL